MVWVTKVIYYLLSSIVQYKLITHSYNDTHMIMQIIVDFIGIQVVAPKLLATIHNLPVAGNS